MRVSSPIQPPVRKMPVIRLFFFVVIACCATSCHRAVSHSQLIDQYRAAACIPVSSMPGSTPRTRVWATSLTLTDGSKVTVSGSQMPGGRIDLHYSTSDQDSVAANAGDYVYPSDVRRDVQRDNLYVKASGLAGGLSHETWLFEYDLKGQRQIARQLVADDVLPAECPESSSVK